MYQISIDNTGLHSAGRCLFGTSAGDADIDGLMQLATQIVFADEINMSSFESAVVRGRSWEILESLSALGLPRSALNIRELDEPAFARACRRAAAKFAEDLEGHRWGAEGVAAMLPFTVPELRGTSTLGSLNELICSGVSDTQRGELLQSAFGQRAAGAEHYMLMSCDALWESVRRLARDSPWGPEQTQQLSVYLRYYLNEEIAELWSSIYAPAVARGRLVLRRTEIVLRALESAFARAAEKLAPHLPGVPSVAGALVLLANGDPAGVIEQAVRAREKATGLRRCIRAFARNLASDEADHGHSTRADIESLGLTLEQELGLREAPRFTDALDFRTIWLLPIPSIPKVREWLTFKMRRRPISVLGEFCKVLADERVDPDALRRLRKKSRRGSSQSHP
jgi:hypothetical protein